MATLTICFVYFVFLRSVSDIFPNAKYYTLSRMWSRCTWKTWRRTTDGNLLKRSRENRYELVRKIFETKKIYNKKENVSKTWSRGCCAWRNEGRTASRRVPAWRCRDGLRRIIITTKGPWIWLLRHYRATTGESVTAYPMKNKFRQHNGGEEGVLFLFVTRCEVACNYILITQTWENWHTFEFYLGVCVYF